MFISDPDIVVRPRVRGGDVPGSLPLLDELAELDGANGGFVALVGPVGSGKTTALRYVRERWGDVHRVFLDDPNPGLLHAHAHKLVVYTARRPVHEKTHRRVFHLAPWTKDEAIEYLLAAGRSACVRVMQRVSAMNMEILDGNAELWHLVLDALCCEEDGGVEDILLRRFQDLPAETRESAMKWSFIMQLSFQSQTNLIGSEARVELGLQYRHLEQVLLTTQQIRLINHPCVQRMLAAKLALQRVKERTPVCYGVAWPRALVETVGGRAAGDTETGAALKECLAQPEIETHSMLASVLLKAQPDWKPDSGQIVSLEKAFLDRAQWAGVDLEEVTLAHASLQGACLDGANLKKSKLRGANLARASLQGARMLGADAAQANFSHAQLDEADFEIANLSKANVSFAKMLGANLRYATLDRANFQRASLLGARLTNASLENANFDEADLTHADFTKARLSGVKLNSAVLNHTCFDDADMERCDLEYVVFRHARMNFAKLNNAHLTGSVMHGAKLRGIQLRNAGLAEIDWEGADLCDADFRGASFHMGSTRSGLVNSVIACEGSKTGFYTDEFYEQSFRAPEAIRKANLRGADLRGAQMLGVDFYLVDLRDAILDAHVLPHLRRCGAILESRV